jgi:hypothetical protein
LEGYRGDGRVVKGYVLECRADRTVVVFHEPIADFEMEIGLWMLLSKETKTLAALRLEFFEHATRKDRKTTVVAAASSQ